MKDLEKLGTCDLDEILEMIEIQMLKTRDYSLTYEYVQVYLHKLLRGVKNG